MHGADRSAHDHFVDWDIQGGSEEENASPLASRDPELETYVCEDRSGLDMGMILMPQLCNNEGTGLGDSHLVTIPVSLNSDEASKRIPRSTYIHTYFPGVCTH